MRILHLYADPHLTHGAAIFEYRVAEQLKEDGIFFDYLFSKEIQPEDAARYADEIAIMHEGRCVLTGAPRELFADAETLQTYRLQLPRIVKFQHQVEKMMNMKLSKICLTEEELADEIARVVKGRDHS